MTPEKLRKSGYSFGDSRDDIAEGIAKLCESLSSEARGFSLDLLAAEAERSGWDPRSLRALCSDALARITTECRGGFRILRHYRAGDSRGSVLLERLEWHLGWGSGNLHSVFGSRFRTSNQYWEFADTFAQLAAYLFSKGSARSHSERWGKLLGIKGES